MSSAMGGGIITFPVRAVASPIRAPHARRSRPSLKNAVQPTSRTAARRWAPGRALWHSGRACQPRSLWTRQSVGIRSHTHRLADAHLAVPDRSVQDRSLRPVGHCVLRQIYETGQELAFRTWRRFRTIRACPSRSTRPARAARQPCCCRRASRTTSAPTTRRGP